MSVAAATMSFCVSEEGHLVPDTAAARSTAFAPRRSWRVGRRTSRRCETMSSLVGPWHLPSMLLILCITVHEMRAPSCARMNDHAGRERAHMPAAADGGTAAMLVQARACRRSLYAALQLLER